MNVELAKLRRDLMLSIRSFFLESDCLEVELPLMGHAVGTDPDLDFFKTTFNSGNKETPLYFHTSPEFWLKRLLAQGYPDIFYLGPTFRNGEVGEQHLPQFSILSTSDCFLRFRGRGAIIPLLFLSVVNCAETKGRCFQKG